ncbi:alkaline phosphatase D family protein [Altericroceibacterium endophyticum]|uniref:Alkaline phosphatase n=1 Tax=Altericroceibacterium endophyticum TaxID=1808508 RepID=A0A6I4T1W5_9SPHN|nr:alkaline phosphatase D family protein [Altericroceibacterium endophyticum]MXO65214.1 alkaline phosphatase [Altericroceibacterium endophyticum]
MTYSINRRNLMKIGALGLGAMSVPGAATILSARGFTHGIASGEPSANSVLLWTRYVASGDTVLRAEIARDAQFTQVVGGGDVTARGEADFTAKITIGDLPTGSWLYYRFIAPDGTISPFGRTRTLPVGDVSRFGIGLFSCSNMPFGWFNAYGHAARRDDLDVLIHCGDYLYEYGNGHYPEIKDVVAGRLVQPDHEILTLADYRMRYAAYRLDPDLQQLHAAYPMIAQWDDHETANDSYKDGAENHQPESEGDWATRKRIAERVYREWMPVSDEDYSAYQIGTLATIFRPETRLIGRVKQLELKDALAGRQDIQRALADFRDGAWSAADRTVMGMKQEKWLYDGISASTNSGTGWQVLAQQIVMGNLRSPSQIVDWVPQGAPEMVQQAAWAAVTASQAGLPFNLDAWDGYPAARRRLYEASLNANADLVVLSGDSHNAWGNNLTYGTQPVGVEFAGHSVTSPGFEKYFANQKPTDVARALQETNPGLVFNDTSRRGYVSLDIRPEAVTGSWHFMKTVLQRDPTVAQSTTMRVRRGEHVLEQV